MKKIRIITFISSVPEERRCVLYNLRKINKRIKKVIQELQRIHFKITKHFPSIFSSWSQADKTPLAESSPLGSVIVPSPHSRVCWTGHSTTRHTLPPGATVRVCLRTCVTSVGVYDLGGSLDVAVAPAGQVNNVQLPMIPQKPTGQFLLSVTNSNNVSNNATQEVTSSAS